MIEQPFKKISFDWIESLGNNARMDLAEESDLLLSQLPLPVEIGTGHYERINLALGMSFSRLIAECSPLAVGKIHSLATINAQFKEPSFQVCIPRGLRMQFEEQYPQACLAPSQGADLYRYTDRYQTKISADCTYSGSVTLLTVAYSVLGTLIGSETAGQLQEKLRISESPSIVVRTTPLFVSNHLISALNPALVGSSRKLFIQAKSLEYLAALVDYVCGKESNQPVQDKKNKKRSQAVHAELMACEGKLPTLDDLASRYGRSAKLLNEEFQSEYGQSIHAFITDHRLQQAHGALQHSNVSIKSISAALGYSHTSNFTIAFKRRFGYPPGSLRKKSVDR